MQTEPANLLELWPLIDAPDFDTSAPAPVVAKGDSVTNPANHGSAPGLVTHVDKGVIATVVTVRWSDREDIGTPGPIITAHDPRELRVREGAPL